MATTEPHSGTVTGWKSSGILPASGVTLSVASIIILGATLWGFGTIYQKLHKNVATNMEKMGLVAEMRNAARARTMCLSNMLILEDPFEIDEIFLAFNRYGAQFAMARQKLLKSNLSTVESAILINQGEFSSKAVPLQNQIVDLIQTGEKDRAHFILTRQAIPWQDLVMEKLTELYDYQEKATQASFENAKQTYENVRLWILIIAAVACIVGIAVGGNIVRRNSRAMQDREKHLADLAEANDKLETARQDAVNASESKSRFLANMSHELRTPLNAILGYCEIIKDEMTQQNVDQNCINDCDKILKSGTYLLNLINEILDISKIEAGKMQVQLEQINTSELVDSVTATIAPLADKKENNFSINHDFQAPTLVSDFMKLKQILINLLANACKFTENGTISLNIGTKINNGQSWFTFIVQDNGAGISQEGLNKLFNPFEQVDSDINRFREGTGLGLALTKGLCELLGGNIDIYSELGKGTTCIVRVPNLSSQMYDDHQAA